MSNVTMRPIYNTMTFTDVWDSAADFKTEFGQSPFAGAISSTEATTPAVTHDNVSRTFYLLYAKYGNNPIANNDINQFKMKVFGVIFQFGPTWEKRLDIQEKLRGLNETELMSGNRAIYNSALNPATKPTTGSLEELNYINSQNTTNYKKGKMEAYAQLWDLLDTDVTGEYIDKFKICFKQFVAPENPLLYVTDAEEVEEDEGE